MRHKKLFKQILDNIKDIKICNTTKSESAFDDPDCPLCMIGNAVRDGIKIPQETAFSYSFSEFFDISRIEAKHTLFPENINSKGMCSGNEYYLLGMKLLEDHK